MARMASAQTIPNTSRFTDLAMENRAYTFLLREQDGLPFGYDVQRNGQMFLQSGELTLFVNPEELVKERPARVSVNQTPNGAWVDSFGLGLPRWIIKGTTGWKARRWNSGETNWRVGAIMDGYMAYHAFADLIETYYTENRRRALEAAKSGGIRLPLLRLVFRDHTDDEWWEIEPEGLPSKVRSKNRPLMIDYLFRFTGITDLKRAKLTLDDPTGLALVGGNARFQRIAAALADAVDNLDAANQALQAAGALDPSGLAALDALADCSINAAQTESERSAIARAQAYASAKSARQDADDWESGHTPTSVQDAALTALRASSDTMLAKTGCSDAGAFKQATTDMRDKIDTAAGAGILSDAGSLTAPLSTAGATVLAEQANVDLSKVAPALSFTERVNGLVQDGKTLVSDVQDFVNEKKNMITTPFRTVQGWTTKIRNMMQSVAIALDTQVFTARLRQALRGMRTQLRGFLCAVQSVVAFPYNFVAGLRNTLQDFFNLFKLSGCASTFPAIKAPSWKPSLPLTIPTPTGG